MKEFICSRLVVYGWQILCYTDSSSSPECGGATLDHLNVCLQKNREFQVSTELFWSSFNPHYLQQKEYS